MRFWTKTFDKALTHGNVLKPKILEHSDFEFQSFKIQKTFPEEAFADRNL